MSELLNGAVRCSSRARTPSHFGRLTPELGRGRHNLDPPWRNTQPRCNASTCTTLDDWSDPASVRRMQEAMGYTTKSPYQVTDHVCVF